MPTKHRCVPAIWVVAISLLACLVPTRLNAQVLYGSVVGTVSDQSGAVVPRANVSITNKATSLKLGATADDSGYYSIPDVPEGSYDLTVSARGFKSLTQTNVRVTINTVTRMDVQLQVGRITEQVTVEATAALLQTEKTDVHTELGTVAIQNLPLNQYRNFQALINLVPGATSGRQDRGFQNAIADSPERALSFNINGTNRNNNNTRVDGAMDVFVWLPHHAVYVPPAETVQEANVTTGSFDAEQGMAGGAAVTVITKSGTNQFHGVAFAYHQDQTLRARQFFETSQTSPQKGKSIFNDDGGTFGGPIKRDKLFFFGSWNGVFQRDNRGQLFTVPTPDIRAGNFTRTGTTIYNPNTGNPDGTGRLPFANQAAVPIDPIAKKVLDFVPLPNLPGDPALDGNSANFFNSATQRLNRNNFDVKIDWNRTEKHRVWGKYSAMRSLFHGEPSFREAVGDCLCDGGLGEFHDLVNLVTIGHSYTISPTLILDGNVGFTRMTEFGQTPDFGQNIGLSVLGIPGTNDPTDMRNSGFPLFAILGFDHIGNPEGWNPAFRNDWSFTNSHNVTWLHGKHEVRFGFDAIHHHLNHWQPELGAGPRGEFDFGGGATALNGGPSPNQFNAFAQFLLGLPGELGVNAGPGNTVGVGKSVQFGKMTGKEWQFGWYVGDRYRITPKLTATIGLRYEYYPLMTRDGAIKFERYDPTTNQIFLGGLGGNDDHLGVTTSHKLFAPRIGLAYQINDSTVVRTGFGITYDPLPLSRPLRGFYPLTVGSNFFGANGFVPAGAFSTTPVVNPVLPAGASLLAGIPSICCPDISKGVLTVPGAALVRSPGPGLLQRGYVESWNVTVERKLPANFVASLGYVGTQTVHQFADLNINASPPGTGSGGQPLNQKFGRAAETDYWQGWLSANYHSLQVATTRQFSNGLMIKGAYTYSHAINWTDDDGWAGLNWNGPDPNIIHRNRAQAGYNIPHIFNLAYVYELPVGKGKKWMNGDDIPSKILGGWQVNGLFGRSQGIPFTVTASGASLNSVANQQTADQIKPVVDKLNGIGPGQLYYDKTAFAPPTGGRFGTSGRFLMRGPGVTNLDFGMFRHFKLTERFELQFRAEALNFFNTPHFNLPNGNASSGAFMQIRTAKNDERQFRLGLRLAF